MENYQDNIDDKWEIIPNDFNVTYKTFPLVFHHDYDKYKLYENSNKIVAPKILLFHLSKYENLKYPIHLKITSEYLLENTQCDTTIFTIMDFNEDIDAIYIPNNFYQHIDLDKLIMTDNNVKFNIVNESLEKATKITLKPFKSSFYQISNPKQYLEIHLKRNYTVLRKGQIISLIFKDTFLDFDIVELSGESGESRESGEFYSIIDTELEVEFQQSYDYVEPVSYPKATAVVNDESFNNENNSDKRFPGKGNRLGS